MTRTDLKAVTSNQEEWVEKAKKYLQQADEVGTRTISRTARYSQHEFLSSVPWKHNTEHEIKYTILAAEAFRIGGEHYWHDCAKAYAHAASLYVDALQDPQNAANYYYYTEAGVVMEKVDTDFSNDYYRQAVTHHCDSSQYNEGAMLQERMANNYRKKEDFEAAIHEYKRATKLYNAANTKDSADRTLDHVAYLWGKTGHFRESADAYESLAMSQLDQNVKKLNAPETFLRAGLMLLCASVCTSVESDLKEVQQLFHRIYSADCRFEESREHIFLADIICCVSSGDLDMFSDCTYSFYKLFNGFDDLMLIALEGTKDVVTRRSEKCKAKNDET